MSKFKTGDKVIVLRTDSKTQKKQEMVGKVGDFGHYIRGNFCLVWQPDKKDCWYFNEDQLELVLPYETIKVTKENKNITVRLQNGKVGKAHCKENDEYNEGIGVVIATARAYGVDLQDCADLVSEKKEKPDLTELKSIIERAKKFLEKEEKQKYKITLSKFWNTEKTLGIHCDTEEKANELLKAFDRLGKRWTIWGDSYLGNNYYATYKQNTVYSNNNRYGSVEFYDRAKMNVYEFNEVDLEN